jgi:phospholipid-binding lipoprotein MlaA
MPIIASGIPARSGKTACHGAFSPYNGAHDFYPFFMILFRRSPFLVALMLLASGCASPSGYKNPKDPFEPLNRGVYKFNDALDKAVVKPAAKGYVKVMPAGGRNMVNNFFSNLDDVLVTLNDVLQFKFTQAVNDGGRFMINTTFGALGLADVAAAGGFPKHHEDFGQTLGYWGVPSGPYLVLPFFGPSSVRDATGLYVDSITGPTTTMKPPRTRNQTVLVNAVRTRANLLDSESLLEEASLDRYAFLRDAYLSHRENEVYDGHPPRPKYYDEEDDNDVPPPPSPPQPAAPPASAPVPASAVPATEPPVK